MRELVTSFRAHLQHLRDTALTLHLEVTTEALLDLDDRVRRAEQLMLGETLAVRCIKCGAISLCHYDHPYVHCNACRADIREAYRQMFTVLNPYADGKGDVS